MPQSSTHPPATLPAAAPRRSAGGWWTAQLLRVAAFLLGTYGHAVAGDAGTRSFDIPAGNAEQTLKQFAAQSGVEVLFSTAAARGVRTNAIKGDLPVEEAVRLLLSGTALYFVNDSKHRVVRIARVPDPNAPRAAPKPLRDRPGTEFPTTPPHSSP